MAYGIVAVATHNEAASTLVKLIPVLIFHGVTTFVAIVCFGLSYRVRKPA